MSPAPPTAPSTPPSTSSEPLYHITTTRAGFLGAFSRSPISEGTLVLSEQPLFVIDAPLQAYLFQRAAGGSGPTPIEGEDEEEEGEAKTLEEFLDRGIRRTLLLRTEEQRKRFYELANTHDELPKAYGIFMTNAVSTLEETGGLFLTLSRFNSGCRPNLSRPLWDPATRTFKLYALHDIEENEELCWPYLGIPFEFDTRDTRRAEMLRVFGFQCCCTACNLWDSDDELRKASDRRLLHLRKLKERIYGDFSGDKTSVLEKMEQLAREEKLWEVAERLKVQLGAEATERERLAFIETSRRRE